MADPKLFNIRQKIISRDHKILGIFVLFLGGFCGRAIIDASGAAAALGVPLDRGDLPADPLDLTTALAGARRTVRATERPLLDLLDSWLGGEAPRSLPPAVRRERLAAAVRFQQLSAPTAAKSVEDTAFYRYGRLVSLNEVGGDPSEFAIDVEEFHRRQRVRQASWPTSMTTLSTHDTKRGEDARTRLLALSEIPEEWAKAWDLWQRVAGPHLARIDGEPHRPFVLGGPRELAAAVEQEIGLDRLPEA